MSDRSKMTKKEALESIRLKFTSANNIPIDRITLTWAEWEAVKPKYRPPRYDDIYFEGLKQLDEAAENDS